MTNSNSVVQVSKFVITKGRSIADLHNHFHNLKLIENDSLIKCHKFHPKKLNMTKMKNTVKYQRFGRRK